MKSENNLKELLHIDFPIIMAPMFLVSNMEMMKAGIRAGIMATFPTLNYRKEGELENVLDELNAYSKNYKGSYGVNIIVQKSNPLSIKHTKICLEKKVPFFITSLGNPKEVIDGAHQYGGKVFCDVTNIPHAKKCSDVNCDGFIAVGVFWQQICAGVDPASDELNEDFDAREIHVDCYADNHVCRAPSVHGLEKLRQFQRPLAALLFARRNCSFCE